MTCGDGFNHRPVQTGADSESNTSRGDTLVTLRDGAYGDQGAGSGVESESKAEAGRMAPAPLCAAPKMLSPRLAALAGQDFDFVILVDRPLESVSALIPPRIVEKVPQHSPRLTT
jgi:hypothetical protein